METGLDPTMALPTDSPAWAQTTESWMATPWWVQWSLAHHSVTRWAKQTTVQQMEESRATYLVVVMVVLYYHYQYQGSCLARPFPELADCLTTL